MRDNVNVDYFEWLSDLVCEQRFSEKTSFRTLLIHLHETEFRYIIPKDANRASDGRDLRRRFIHERGYPEGTMVFLDSPCSVLEMMVALAIRCEESIMDDPHVGDRTGHWFWGMITNMGLGSMFDSRYDEKIVEKTIQKVLDRKYEPNGRGGLFTVRNCDRDLREVEIWYQLCWYLDSIS